MTANAALVRDGIAALNSGDLRAWLATFDPNGRLYPLDVGLDFEAVYDGDEGLASFWDRWFEPWDRLRLELVSIDDGDVVVLDARWIGETAGAPPVEMPVGIALAVRDGRWTLTVAAPTATEARHKLLTIAQDPSAS